MKKLILVTLVISFSFLIQAQPPAGKAAVGDHYGEKVQTEGALALSDIVRKLEGGSNFPEVKIKAKVAEVCAKSGCWMKLELPNGKQAIVNMKDYGFFVPIAAKGKTVVIDGEAILKTSSVEELRHYAEDAMKTKAEIEAITEPKKEIKITARGIVIVE